MSIAEHAEPQLAERPTMLPPNPLPEVDFDVVITVSDGDQGPQGYSAFAQNYCDLGWWATMNQSKVSPVSFTARKVIGRASSAVPLTLAGTAALYNPVTQAWSSVVTVPTTYHPTGKVTFDPRSLVTAQYPWIGSLGLLAWASASYGVGLNRVFARTVVHADGYIGYIN
ncbi:hypothetical protein GCM10011492_11530 [Flexivirga endophytica]|uniref:Uncharacterized protein n=1 Tax=Flexivirga endophytica TaxID=1849103 RepID=A0A916SZD6_9MICO|nr:hypothetical protein [Flexivirga endophytica]GGB23354.1 hypothetical protein GCM10011492_11530 [Flexivirga endophytica]GHB57288.1 hypothetical protein GCM10008112_28070 [Flexivirga endophytica]